VVFRTCQEEVVQKERLASLGQASVEFVHANNPIPRVSGNRISRFRGVSCYSVVSTGSSPIFEDSDRKLLSTIFLTPLYNEPAFVRRGYTHQGWGVVDSLQRLIPCSPQPGFRALGPQGCQTLASRHRRRFCPARLLLKCSPFSSRSRCLTMIRTKGCFVYFGSYLGANRKHVQES
jgi:hypothetical protein